jgi:hypothetical protein
MNAKVVVNPVRAAMQKRDEQIEAANKLLSEAAKQAAEMKKQALEDFNKELERIANTEVE